MMNMHLSESTMNILRNRPLFRENLGRSGAGVWYAGDDLVIKTNAPGTLKRAYDMHSFLFPSGLSPEALHYESGETDVLILRRLEGESAVSKTHLSDPERLSHALGNEAFRLHAVSAENCPKYYLTNEWNERFSAKSFDELEFDPSYSSFLGITEKDQAYEIAKNGIAHLSQDTVLHGDMCLPNFMLNDFRFTGFIDLGEGGIGDRHYDLFWAMWSMNYNLKTNKWSEAFLSAYGREKTDMEKIRVFASLVSLGI
ncbi:MAG: phosphotransferase [Clostridia bacterium]|nr:phosphotransferase [Clostridia bacterium]